MSLTWSQCDDISSCENPVCPDCDLVDCLAELEQEMCPEGYTLTENMAFGGCCPACVKYMDFDGGLQKQYRGSLGKATVFAGRSEKPSSTS